jgi:hypothetical protein
MISARPPESRSSVANSWKTRVVRAQHRNSTGQANVFRSLCGCGKYDGRRGDGVVGAVVLANAEDIETYLVGQFDLLEEVAQPLCRVDLGADIGESVEAKFHCRFLSGRDRCTQTFWGRFKRREVDALIEDLVPPPTCLVVRR